MEKIYDKAVIERCLKRSRLSGQFDITGFRFTVFRYQKEEFLSRPQQPLTHFQFLVTGSVALYYLEENGSRKNVAVIDTSGLLGDMEFVLGNTPLFYAEALTPTTVLALPMEEYRPRLEKDCAFLLYLLRQAARIKILSARNSVVMPRLEERLLYHLKNDCPRQTLIGMENTAVKLLCSRRQLQRVVKKLEEQGRLEKLGRGRYRLKEPSSPL